MKERFERTALLLGEEGLNRLQQKHVAVFGVGGVGGYAVEALARSGIGELTIVDKDEVTESNINRQIIATIKTVGRKKVDVMEERIAEINPDCTVHKYACFYLPENAAEFDFSQYDYVVDAVDTVTAKLELILQARKAGVPVISSMGAGNKLDPARFEVADIYETSVCPLARVMRRELKKRGVDGVKVVYSKEEPLTPAQDVSGAETDGENQEKDRAGQDQSWGSQRISTGRKAVPGSIAFVPSAAGLILAGAVIRELAEVRSDKE